MTKKEIGAVLMRQRKALKLSMYVVERKTGVTNQQLRKMEKGDSNYTIDSLLKVCKFLEIELCIVL